MELLDWECGPTSTTGVLSRLVRAAWREVSCLKYVQGFLKQPSTLLDALERCERARACISRREGSQGHMRKLDAVQLPMFPLRRMGTNTTGDVLRSNACILVITSAVEAPVQGGGWEKIPKKTKLELSQWLIDVICVAHVQRADLQSAEARYSGRQDR